ncbi:hypothetical protein JCGZ_08973 [Jatropha curcas]|uniref:Uncharacterized protein n=1 Tax=Jatropha curcas TaxID=180498 RepID=A0A067KTD0_JATCU|nr:hypothetical protein JCGZ_08973 [Jatropha curcas]
MPRTSREMHAPDRAKEHARACTRDRNLAHAAEARSCYTTSKRMHARSRASTHARALELPQTVRNNTARAESPRLPEPGTPQTVPGSTPVPSKKS